MSTTAAIQRGQPWIDAASPEQIAAALDAGELDTYLTHRQGATMIDTDRAAALTAAVRDLARDLQAELAILARYRGTDTPSTGARTFKDPGPDLATYERQKAEAPGNVRRLMASYRALLDAVRGHAGSLSSPTLRGELLTLIASVSAVSALDEATELVDSFGEA